LYRASAVGNGYITTSASTGIATSLVNASSKRGYVEEIADTLTDVSGRYEQFKSAGAEADPIGVVSENSC
jgi:hypothetical protein